MLLSPSPFKIDLSIPTNFLSHNITSKDINLFVDHLVTRTSFYNQSIPHCAFSI